MASDSGNPRPDGPTAAGLPELCCSLTRTLSLEGDLSIVPEECYAPLVPGTASAPRARPRTGLAGWLVNILRLAVVALFLTVYITPIVSGIRFLTVITGSMSPTIPVGTIIVVLPAPATAVKPGQVVAYRMPDNPQLVVTHRVVEVIPQPLGFKTKGDANQAADSYAVPPGNLIGVVDHWVPNLGNALRFIQTPVGFILFTVLPVIVLVGREVLRASARR